MEHNCYYKFPANLRNKEAVIIIGDSGKKHLILQEKTKDFETSEFVCVLNYCPFCGEKL